MSMTVAQLEAAKARFGELLVEQDKRIERMKAQGDFINYAKLDKIIIGVCGGDGIGPAITGQAQRILEFLLEEEVEKIDQSHFDNIKKMQIGYLILNLQSAIEVYDGHER